MTKHNGRDNQTGDAQARRRHGFGFFARVVVFGAILVAAIAIAGDDELRASLASWVRSADRPWG